MSELTVRCTKHVEGKSWPITDMMAGKNEYTCEGRTATTEKLWLTRAADEQLVVAQHDSKRNAKQRNHHMNARSNTGIETLQTSMLTRSDETCRLLLIGAVARGTRGAAARQGGGQGKGMRRCGLTCIYNDTVSIVSPFEFY